MAARNKIMTLNAGSSRCIGSQGAGGCCSRHMQQRSTRLAAAVPAAAAVPLLPPRQPCQPPAPPPPLPHAASSSSCLSWVRGARSRPSPRACASALAIPMASPTCGWVAAGRSGWQTEGVGGFFLAGSVAGTCKTSGGECALSAGGRQGSLARWGGDGGCAVRWWNQTGRNASLCSHDCLPCPARRRSVAAPGPAPAVFTPLPSPSGASHPAVPAFHTFSRPRRLRWAGAPSPRSTRRCPTTPRRWSWCPVSWAMPSTG